MSQSLDAEREMVVLRQFRLANPCNHRDISKDDEDCTEVSKYLVMEHCKAMLMMPSPSRKGDIDYLVDCFGIVQKESRKKYPQVWANVAKLECIKYFCQHGDHIPIPSQDGQSEQKMVSSKIFGRLHQKHHDSVPNENDCLQHNGVQGT